MFLNPKISPPIDRTMRQGQRRNAHGVGKYATNYSENYMFLFYQQMIWRKYAILTKVSQQPDN